jgi:N utilization substance protein A
MQLDGKVIQAAIMQLVDDYKFDPYQVIDIVKMGIRSAFRKDFAEYKRAEVVADIDDDGSISIYRQYEVVAEVEDDQIQIDLEQAQEMREDAEIGEQMLIDITPDHLTFTRIGIQAAAQTIKQYLKGIERERFFDKFQHKEGELLRAKVTKAHGDTVVLDIEGVAVVLPADGQIPKRMYEIGEDIFVYLKQISKDSTGITLDITQASEEYIEAIIRKIVPEVEEGTVVIEKIARAAGIKTKVVVNSKDPNIDAVGVMIGHKGDRINILLSLLDGEKVDFIQYSDDTEKMIKACLKPADAQQISIHGNKAQVVINENQKAMAIGKSASNIKLASKLCGMSIEII